ncbi:MAG: hypothetical protein Q9195_002818 [Heterodermia aff. obscurata]
MAAVDFVTGYITNYVDGMVRPYVEQGAAAVGDVAGGVMFSVGDKVSAVSRGVGDTITGYTGGVGRGVSGMAGGLPGAPKTSEATKRVEQTASNPLGLSGQSSKAPKAIEAPKQKPLAAPKKYGPSPVSKQPASSISAKAPIPSSAAGRRKETDKFTKGASSAVAGPAKGALNKTPNVGGAFDVPKVVGSAPKPSAPKTGSLSKPGGAHEVPKLIGSGSVAGDAPAEAERRSRRTTRRLRRPRE